MPALERVKVDLRKIFEKGQGQSRLLLNAGFDLALANLRILISQRMWPCRERPTSSHCRCSTSTQRRSVIPSVPPIPHVEGRQCTDSAAHFSRSCVTQRYILPVSSINEPLRLLERLANSLARFWCTCRSPNSLTRSRSSPRTPHLAVRPEYSRPATSPRPDRHFPRPRLASFS